MYYMSFLIAHFFSSPEMKEWMVCVCENIKIDFPDQ